MFDQRPLQTDCVQVKALFTQEVYFAPLNIYRKSLSSPRSLWGHQQPKLLSGIACLDPCAACFDDNLQAFPRKARLTSVRGTFQADKQTDTRSSTRLPRALKILKDLVDLRRNSALKVMTFMDFEYENRAPKLSQPSLGAIHPKENVIENCIYGTVAIK